MYEIEFGVVQQPVQRQVVRQHYRAADATYPHHWTLDVAEGRHQS